MLDQSGFTGASGTQTSITSASITTTVADSALIVWTYASANANFSAGTGYSNLKQDRSTATVVTAMESQIVNATGTYGGAGVFTCPSFTASGSTGIVNLKAAAGGGGGGTPTNLFFGMF